MSVARWKMAMHAQKSMVQFSLRWLFAAVSATAVCALVARQCGWVEALGVAIAFTAVAIAIQIRDVPCIRLVRSVLGLVAALAIWIVGVDLSHFRVACPHCHSHWLIMEVRVFGLAAYSRKSADHYQSLRLIAEALGAPCPHQYERQHNIRLWGLVYPNPANRGICCAVGGDWYVDSEMRALVRSMAHQKPELGSEFRNRVLLAHDILYEEQFLADLHAAAKPAPAEATSSASASAEKTPQSP